MHHRCRWVAISTSLGHVNATVGSLLIPLQGTLPGWPAAPQPSLASVLLLALGVPLAIGIVVSVLGKGQQMVQASHQQRSGGTPIAAGSSRAELPAGDARAARAADEEPRETEAAPRRELRS